MKKIRFYLTLLLFTGIIISCQTTDKVLVEGGILTLNERKIEIRDFMINRYETTNKEYAEFLNDSNVGSDGIMNGIQIINIASDDLQLQFNGIHWSARQGKENCPVVMVNYYGALEFSRWAGGNLPTVPEWIYAAKGGNKSKNFIYAGSNDLKEVGWFRDNCGGHSHNVGELIPNELKIYDMSGNAWEWCLNDSLRSVHDFCLHMGGSWFPGEKESRIESRFGNTPDHLSNSVGFRVIYPVK